MTDVTRSSWARPPKRAITVGAFLASVLAASATLAAAGATANVKGKITGWEKLLPQVYLDATKSDSRRYTWREPSPTVKQEFRRLSANVSRDVCIAAFSAAAAPARAIR